MNDDGPIESLDEYLNEIRPYDYHIFRGQEKESWNLQPSIFREEINDNIDSETYELRFFKGVAFKVTFFQY